jgi:MscS family membrane protein
MTERVVHWWHALAQGTSVGWVQDLVLLWALCLLLWGIWWVIGRRLESLADKTENKWDDAFIYGVRRPLSVLILSWATLFSLGIIIRQTTNFDTVSLQVMRYLMVVLSIIWICLRWINRFEDNIVATGKRDLTTITAVSKILRLTVWIIGILLFMQNLGVSISGILTFGGVGGIIVGMASKDLLANFFGALIIYFDKPFKVGDWVRSPDRNIEGTVEKIGFRVTIIRTFDKRPLYVPNSVFSSIVVENPSRMLNRRIYETIGLRYEDSDKVEAIVNAVRDMLEQHPDIDQRQTLMVNFNAFNASSLDFFVYTFTKTTNWMRYHTVKENVLTEILAIIHRHGADIAFPTQALHISHDTLVGTQ